MKVTLLGCGSSRGLPHSNGFWGDCNPKNPKNHRSRAGLLIQEGNTVILVDTSPELRQQLAPLFLTHLTALLWTHTHADHVNGIEDIRPFRDLTNHPIEAYGTSHTLKTLTQRFSYCFHATHRPQLFHLNTINPPTTLTFETLKLQIFQQEHGDTTSLGIKCSSLLKTETSLCYSNDVVSLSKEAFNTIKGTDIWIVDALRYKPHPNHAHLEKTLKWIKEAQPKRSILTNLSSFMDYEQLKASLPPTIEPGFDGLQLVL